MRNFTCQITAGDIDRGVLESFASITKTCPAVHTRDRQLRLYNSPTPLQIYHFFCRCHSTPTIYHSTPDSPLFTVPAAKSTIFLQVPLQIHYFFHRSRCKLHHYVTDPTANSTTMSQIQLHNSPLFSQIPLKSLPLFYRSHCQLQPYFTDPAAKSTAFLTDRDHLDGTTFTPLF